LFVVCETKWTFWQRYKHELIFFGIPVACLELIGIPAVGWVVVVAVMVPATLIGLLVSSAIEQWIISVLAESQKS
jgi:putative effector of murein hydrolase LrgA (UPF0299 family)